jgi:lysophospholipase L1-like esterase
MKTQTILFLGDSISDGVGASNNANRFTTLLTQQLQTEDCKFIEKNLAISGSTLIQSGFSTMLSQAIEEKPDIFVIQHGVNDNTFGNSLSSTFAILNTIRLLPKI